MDNAAYKAERRIEARKAGICTICIKRKARKGRITCTRCSKMAGIRRDLSLNRISTREAREARKDITPGLRPAVSTQRSKSATRQKTRTSRPAARAKSRA